MPTFNQPWTCSQMNRCTELNSSGDFWIGQSKMLLTCKRSWVQTVRNLLKNTWVNLSNFWRIGKMLVKMVSQLWQIQAPQVNYCTYWLAETGDLNKSQLTGDNIWQSCQRNGTCRNVEIYRYNATVSFRENCWHKECTCKLWNKWIWLWSENNKAKHWN